MALALTSKSHHRLGLGLGLELKASSLGFDLKDPWHWLWPCTRRLTALAMKASDLGICQRPMVLALTSKMHSLGLSLGFGFDLLPWPLPHIPMTLALTSKTRGIGFDIVLEDSRP